MNVSIEVVAFACGIAIAMAVIAFFVIHHATRIKNIKSGETWLFDQWQLHAYTAIFKDKDPQDIGRSIGIDVEKYLRGCELIRKKPNVEEVIIDKICGFIIIGVFAIAGLIMMQIPLMLVGVIVAFPLIALPVHFTEEAVDKRKERIAEELPRFLDMLHTALLIGMPVNQAIEITAKKLSDTIIAEEMLDSLAETKMGTANWQEALEKLANKYGVDTLSDFVLDITNAYNLGSPVADSVARKSKDIKETNLIAMKERASKLTNTVLIPITVFKMLPIIAIMAIPMILQLQASGF